MTLETGTGPSLVAPRPNIYTSLYYIVSGSTGLEGPTLVGDRQDVEFLAMLKDRIVGNGTHVIRVKIFDPVNASSMLRPMLFDTSNRGINFDETGYNKLRGLAAIVNVDQLFNTNNMLVVARYIDGNNREKQNCYYQSQVAINKLLSHRDNSSEGFIPNCAKPAVIEYMYLTSGTTEYQFQSIDNLYRQLGTSEEKVEDLESSTFIAA